MSGSTSCGVSPATPLELQSALINRVLGGGVCACTTPRRLAGAPALRFLCAP
jgi:hypothetical protein